MAKKTKILIVDDEADILDLLEYNLKKEDFAIVRASDGDEAVRKVKEENPSLVLLDIMMPKMDGVEACRQIRALPNGQEPYIVFLTARSEEYSEIAGLDAGADDYIAKPISPRLLVSRIAAILRRGSRLEPEINTNERLIVHDLEISEEEYVVYKKGKAISLPKKEFELLHFLASKPGKVFSREVILEKIWGTDVQVVDRTIDVHVRKLREKLGKNYIKTLKGVGYKFMPPND